MAKQLFKLLLRSFGLDLVTYRPFLELLTQWQVDTVLDVGANTGQFKNELRAAGFNGHIISFEPTQKAFHELQHKARHDAFWEVEHVGLGQKNETRPVSLPLDSRLTSLLVPVRDHKFVGNEIVQIQRLDNWLSSRKIHLTNACLKLDVQGFELEVLIGAGNYLERFGSIIIELSFYKSYEGQPYADEILAFLRRFGFVVWATRRGLWDFSEKREMEFDALLKRV